MSVAGSLETLFDHRLGNLPPIAFAEVFDRLIWCLEDNGSAIVDLQRAWLSSNDPERVRVALKMAEVFPFTDQVEMDRALDRITTQWPEFAADCRQFRNTFERCWKPGPSLW